MNTDRGEKIRVHPCPSVVKKFAQRVEAFGHNSGMNWTRMKEEGCANSANGRRLEATRGNPPNVAACESQPFAFIRVHSWLNSRASNQPGATWSSPRYASMTLGFFRTSAGVPSAILTP